MFYSIEYISDLILFKSDSIKYVWFNGIFVRVNQIYPWSNGIYAGFSE